MKALDRTLLLELSVLWASTPEGQIEEEFVQTIIKLGFHLLEGAGWKSKAEQEDLKD